MAFSMHAEGGAGDGRVAEFTRVAALRLFASVGVGALRPVVAAHSRAPLDLIGVHAELVRAEDSFVNVVDIVLSRSENIGKLALQ